VAICVTDTGTGMTPEVMARAFEPFFTTKPVGQGTGLGLSQAYGFAQQSGGHLKISSEVGHGTTVKLYLPRHVGAAPSGTQAADPLPLATPPAQTTILVVEDEESVRQFAVDALREVGHRVLEAPDGAAALQLLGEHPEITLLLTDVVLPKLDGRELADAAVKVRPGLKVLFMTGYTQNAIVHDGKLDPGVSLIGKPFTVRQLSSKVRETLGRST
jgi:CheY-like chemotaxis protein